MAPRGFVSDDEDEFERLMSERGLAVKTSVKGIVSSSPPIVRGPAPSHSAQRVPIAAKAAASPPPNVAPNPLFAEVSRLHAEAESLRVALAGERRELAADRAAAKMARASDSASRIALEAALASAAAERDAARLERRAADRRLGESQQSLAEIKAKMERLARLRSLNRISDDIGEKALAMRALLERFPGPTLAALAADDEAAWAAIVQRVVFTCEQPSCRMKSDVARVSVPRDRCDVCGGSILVQRFAEFLDACQKEAITHVLVVGGSPAYRETLRELSREHRRVLKLTLTQELAPDDAERAKKVKGLVILWGATEVDHTKTGIFASAGDRRLIVAHRGLTGMLREVTGRLTGLPPTPTGGHG